FPLSLHAGGRLAPMHTADAHRSRIILSRHLPNRTEAGASICGDPALSAISLGRVFRWYDPRRPQQTGRSLGGLDPHDRVRFFPRIQGGGVAAPLFALTMVLTLADGSAHTHGRRPVPRPAGTKALEPVGRPHSASGCQC